MVMMAITTSSSIRVNLFISGFLSIFTLLTVCKAFVSFIMIQKHLFVNSKPVKIDYFPNRDIRRKTVKWNYLPHSV